MGTKTALNMRAKTALSMGAKTALSMGAKTALNMRAKIALRIGAKRPSRCQNSPCDPFWSRLEPKRYLWQSDIILILFDLIERLRFDLSRVYTKRLTFSCTWEVPSRALHAVCLHLLPNYRGPSTIELAIIYMQNELPVQSTKWHPLSADIKDSNLRLLSWN
jgi:hypothetical protein